MGKVGVASDGNFIFVDLRLLRVQGFAGGNLLYDNTYPLNDIAPTLLSFDYVGVDQVRFTITSSPSGIFAMDHLTVVPEPGVGALLSGALLGLGALARKWTERPG